MEENTNTETLVRRLLSTDFTDKVIVTTIQKLGLALDGTKPIFSENPNYKIREGGSENYKTSADIFEKELHTCTITHAIEDRNVLRFHIDFFKGKGNQNPKPGEAIAQQAVAEAIINKHGAATNQRKFNAVLATAFSRSDQAIYTQNL